MPAPQRLRCGAVAALLSAVGVLAGSAGDGSAPPTQIRFTTESPVIDGRLDDACWQKADTATGFTVPVSLDLAADPSQVRALFDEERVCFALKAYESSPESMSREGGLFSTESFEIFVQPDPAQEVYYQIAVSVTGEVYTGRIKSKWSPDIEVATSVEAGFWAAELALPLADLGMTSPRADTSVRFNICRNDWAAPAGRREGTAGYSSFSLLEIADFHVPEVWSTATMTRKQMAPREVVNESPYRNLLENPEFDLAGNSGAAGWPSEYWRIGDVQRRETMAMSGEWIVAAKGKAYVAVQQKVDLTPGAVYTVRVKARRVGDCAFGIQQVFRNGTSGSVLWDCPLTTDFRYYYAPFTATGDTRTLAFYRLGPRTESDGLELASIHLFEGKLSPLAIRRYVRTGMTRKVAGTEHPIPPNFFGPRHAGPRVRLLAVAYTLYTSRELEELLAGLDVDADILISTGWNQDTYYTEGDPRRVEERLEKREYDVYLLGSVAVDRVGKELAGKVFANVEKGAGLIISFREAVRDGRFRVISKYKAEPVSADHYLAAGLPTELYPQGRPIKSILEARVGEGRIVAGDFGVWDFQLRVPQETLSYLTFPHQRYSRAWLARLLYYGAGRVPLSIAGIEVRGNEIRVRFAGIPQPGELEWHVADKNGRLVSRGKSTARDMRSEISLPELTLSGHHALALWLKDDADAVLDYSACAIPHLGPRIAELESAREFHTGTEPGEFTAVLADADESMELTWRLEDFSGRILESGRAPAAETVRFTVPLTSVYTNLARLWVCLRAGGTERDAQRFAVYLPDRDGQRLLNDFNVTVWPEGCTNPDAAPFINRSLEAIGVRAKNQTYHELCLNDGLGTTTNLACGEFWASVPKTKHVRKPSLRDPEVLRAMADKAATRARHDRKYGPFSVQVVDEPESSPRWAFVELDAHPECLNVYRQRMRAKYGSIERFNRRCSTRHASFDEIGLVLTEQARQRENFAEFLEWRNYMVDTWVEAFRLVVDAYQAENPAPPISMENSFGQRALNGNDYWKLLTKGGFGFANEYTDAIAAGPIRSFAELYRSFRPDMRVWGFIGYGFSRDSAQFKPWWFALHRFGGFSYYATTGERPGEGAWNLVSVPGFGLSRKGQILSEGGMSELLYGLGRVFLEYEWHKRDIAVLYSQPSMLVAWCRGTEERDEDLVKGSPYHDFFHSRHAVARMLEELLFQYDFVSPEQVADDKLDSYRVLVLPHIGAMSDTCVRKVTEFVNGGGTVITDIVPGTYDDLGTPRRQPPFPDPDGARFVRFAGPFDDKDDPSRRKMVSLLARAGVEPILRCEDVASVYGREAMRFVRGDLNVYAVIRDYRRSTDTMEQEFVFPREGHLYNLRTGEYLGETDRVRCAIPNAGTEVYGQYPYQVTGVTVESPADVRAGTDLLANIKVATSTGRAGHHVFHLEVVPPLGEARWLMRRNLPGPEGGVRFRFRMAENDPIGTWTLRVTDVMSGKQATREFALY